MSQAPQQDPPSLHPTPDDPYSLQPVQTSKARNLTAEIITISVIAAGLVLLGVGLMLWYRDSRPAAPLPAPTSTPTVTVQTVTAPAPSPSEIAARPQVTPRSTRTADADAVAPSPSAVVSQTAIPTRTLRPSVTLPLIAGGAAMPTPSAIALGLHLPAVSAEGPGQRAEPTVPTETPTAEPAAPPVAQSISMPFISREEAPPTATATAVPPTATPEPTATLPPIDVTAETVTATPVAVASSPTPTPVATVPPFVVGSLKAKIDRPSAQFYIGPSAIYTATDTLSADEEITLYGRDNSAEWVYACCVIVDDEADTEGLAWVRQAYVRIEGNESDSDPDDFNANDARWLRIEPVRQDLRPLPVVTPPPEGDYPLLRYTPDNRGFVPNLPNLSTAVRPWTDEPEAGGAILSPLIVAGSYVYGGSSDNHVYAWDRSNGSQRARRNLGSTVTVAPATDDGLIYVADNTGTLYALQDKIDEGDPFWTYNLGAPPISGINVFSHTLFINTSQRLLVIDGEDRELLYSLSLPADPLYPTIGGQLLYVVADSVRAYDVLTMVEGRRADLVWERPGIPRGIVPPVYSGRGVESVAELYVAGGNDRIYSLDANTGDENWNIDNEERVTGLAVNDAALFVAGDGYIKARSREDGEELWRTPVGGPVLGGPLVNDEYIIAFLQNGSIVFLTTAGQDASPSYPTYPAAATAAGAVSFPYVYTTGQDFKLYSLRQSP